MKFMKNFNNIARSYIYLFGHISFKNGLNNSSFLDMNKSESTESQILEETELNEK